MAMTAVKRFANAIGYPDEVPDAAVEYAFLIDDGETRASESDGRLLLERTLWSPPADMDGSESVLCRVASLAAGRVLREEAAPAWNPRRGELVLTQEVPASFPDEKLRRFGEVFSASCDWWKERVDGELGPAPVFPEMMIMP